MQFLLLETFAVFSAVVHVMGEKQSGGGCAALYRQRNVSEECAG